MKNNEISYPVSLDSEKGSVFVIKRLETESPRLLSFEEVSQEIAMALKNVKSVDLAKAKPMSFLRPYLKETYLSMKLPLP